MTGPAEVAGAFFAAWGEDPHPVSAAELDQVAVELGVKLPGPYRDFMLRYGSISTQRLMATVAEVDPGLPALLLFYDLDEILESTAACAAAGARGLFCFAARMLGGSFCFKIDECNSAGGGDVPVWLYVRQDEQPVPIAEGFVAFLRLFRRLST